MARRSKAREVALQMLFQVDLNADVDTQAVHTMITEQFSDSELREFCWTLFSGTVEQLSLLNTQIVEVAQNWSLSRMAPTDRNVLRLGAYELLFLDTPYEVVIDEAIELARKFGSETSPQFVNGLLDKLVPDEKRDSPSED